MNSQMIPIIKLIVNWFTKNYKAVAVGFICLLIATVFVQNNQLKKKDKEIDRITNNVRAYEQIASNNEDNNRVLQLTIEELNQSKDSLLQQLNKVRKEQKVKDKNLESAQVINTEINDSVKTVIKYKSIDFKEELKLNSLTTIIVSRTDSILSAKLNIKNQQTIFVQEKKEYKNFYRNGWTRFWHFDWKRIKTRKYQIINSNSIIKVTGTRVIEVSK